MNNVIDMFLLVSSSVRSKQLLCFVHGQGQNSVQKHTTKNFVGFHNHSLLLTMVIAISYPTRAHGIIVEHTRAHVLSLNYKTRAPRLALQN